MAPYTRGPVSVHSAPPSTDDGLVPSRGAADADDSLWGPQRRQLTIGLVLTITLVAFEALAVATVMPSVKDDLGGLGLYGWVFSGFFLTSILGIVVAGRLADRRGLVLPFAAGLALFSVGLVAGGAASSMGMLVLARLAQGFGAGAVPATGYAAIARGYPPHLHPRMFATTSTAWVVPGLIGPAIATLVEHALSWRWVFLGIVPIVVVAAVMTIPALAKLGGDAVPGPVAPDVAAADRRRLARVVVLVLAVGAVLGAGTGPPLLLAVPLVVAGLPCAVWAFVGLVPVGTLRLAHGVPATIGVRGVLTWAFFAADAYVPLAIIDGRGAATWVAGAALSMSCVFWAIGSWVQARLIVRVGPRRLDEVGFAVIAFSVLLLVGVTRGLPVGLAVLAWGLGGLGMGVAYSPLSVTVLAAAPPGEEGGASASLQLSDTLGIAIGTGIGGWIVAVAASHHWTVSSGLTIVFSLAFAMAVAGVFASRRLPEQVPSGAREAR